MTCPKSKEAWAVFTLKDKQKNYGFRKNFNLNLESYLGLTSSRRVGIWKKRDDTSNKYVNIISERSRSLVKDKHNESLFSFYKTRTLSWKIVPRFSTEGLYSSLGTVVLRIYGVPLTSWIKPPYSFTLHSYIFLLQTWLSSGLPRNPWVIDKRVFNEFFWSIYRDKGDIETCSPFPLT